MLRYQISLLLAPLLCDPSLALNAYGHAYSRPNDFTATQYDQIAKRFSIFTVEKDHAAAVYGNKTAPRPFRSNSIAASVGTARKIKALNPSMKVLMYWNTALFFNLYECEAEVDQEKWLNPPMKKGGPRLYNYKIPEFRAWWVKCAVDAIKGSNGLLDGLFLDATPKLEKDGAIRFWGPMIEVLKKRLPGVILVDNGFYLAPNGKMDGGEDAWSHTNFGYIESLYKIGTPVMTPQLSMVYLTDLSNASSAHPAPGRKFIGHGYNKDKNQFYYGLAKFLMITSSVKDSYFLANKESSYSIDGGLLEQPTSVYSDGDGVGCGEPADTFFTRGGARGFVVQRAFRKGIVTIDLNAQTAKIDCTGLSYWYDARMNSPVLV